MTPAPQAFLFPGQGSQTVGMGRRCAAELQVARQVFSTADEALGFELSRLCWEGPEEELQLTANTQPAILTVSVALYRALEELGQTASAMAGHSLGEYSALVAAGALDFVDAVRLVRRRGQLMQEAVAPSQGAMAAVLGLEAEAVARIAEKSSRAREVCAVANLNAPAQTVIAGHRKAVDRALEEAKRAGARRAVRLAVSAPFHSPLMAPVRERMAPLLAEVAIADARVPVVSNVDARPLQRADEIRDALRRQIDRPVRWVESVERMHRDLGVARFVEVGPGRVLTGLVRRIVPEAETAWASDPESLRDLSAA